MNSDGSAVSILRDAFGLAPSSKRFRDQSGAVAFRHAPFETADRHSGFPANGPHDVRPEHSDGVRHSRPDVGMKKFLAKTPAVRKRKVEQFIRKQEHVETINRLSPFCRPLFSVSSFPVVGKSVRLFRSVNSCRMQKCGVRFSSGSSLLGDYVPNNEPNKRTAFPSVRLLINGPFTNRPNRSRF